jgi:hypothetical protein
MASSTRLRAPSLVIRAARWNLTVLVLMWSSCPISAFVFSRAVIAGHARSPGPEGADDHLTAGRHLEGGGPVGPDGAH